MLLRKLSVFLSEFIHDGHAEHARDIQYSKSIELENAECINIRGNHLYQKNRITTSQYSAKTFLYKLLITFFSRYLNLYLLVVNLVSLSYIEWQPMHYSYFSSLALSLFVFLLREIYFDRLKRLSDEAVNGRKATIFQNLRKQLQINPKRTLSRKLLKNISVPEYEKQINLNLPRQTDLHVLPQPRGSLELHPPSRQDGSKINLMTQKRWDQIEIGDIIFLRYNEVCPADLLILEMSNTTFSAGCAVFNGNTNEVRKRACPLTTISKEHRKTISLLDYRMMLSGVIRYDQSASDFYYKGIVKLKKDPQPVEITKENILFREQLLLNAYYIYGIVLGVGFDCRCYQGYKKLERKRFFGYFEEKANLYFLIATSIAIFLSLVLYLVKKYGVLESHQIWSNEFLRILILYSNLLPTYFYFFIDLEQLVRISYNNYKFLHQEDHQATSCKQIVMEHTKPKYRQTQLQLNSSNIGNLSLVNHVIFDKTGTITQPSFKIKTLFVFDNNFRIRNKRFGSKEYQLELHNSKILNEYHEPIKEESPQKSPVEQKDIINFKLQDMDDENPPYDDMHRTAHFKGLSVAVPESIPSSCLESSDCGRCSSHQKLSFVSKHDDKRINNRGSRVIIPKHNSHLEIITEKPLEETQLEMLKRFTSDSDFKPRFYECMYSLVICHDIRSLYSRQDDCLTYEYATEMDRLQMKFAGHFGYKFICRSFSDTQLRYIIEDDLGVRAFDVMAIHQFNSRRISVIVRIGRDMMNRLQLTGVDCEYIQYLRDDSLEMLGCLGLEKEQMAKLMEMLLNMQKEGIRSIPIYRSIMNNVQMTAFIKDANKIVAIQSSKIEQSGEYQFLMHEFQRNCDLVTIIGVSEKVKKQDSEAVKVIQDLGFPCWLASGDIQEKVLPIAFRQGFLNSTDQTVRIDGRSAEELYGIIKNQLHQIQNQLKSSDETRRSADLFRKGSFSSSPNIMLGKNQNSHLKQLQLVISGESLQFIQSDSYLWKHFVFLLQFTKNLVGFKMLPQHKEILLKLIKSNKLNYKNILSVGDGFSDINMFQESDFAIQVESRRILSPYEKFHLEKMDQARVSITQLDQDRTPYHMQFPSVLDYDYQTVEPFGNADIYLKNIGQLLHILLVDSRPLAQFFDRQLVFSLYRSFGLISLLFLSSSFKHHEDEPLIQQTLLVYHPNLFLSVTILQMGIHIFNHKSVSERIEIKQNQDFNAFLFLTSNQEFRKNKIQKYLTRITLLPLFQALIICLFLEVVNTSLTQDGKVVSREQISTGVFFMYLIFEILKLIQRDVISYGQGLIQLLAFFVIFILICIGRDNILWMEFAFGWLTSAQMIMLVFIISLLFHILFNLIVGVFFKPFFPLVDIYIRNHLRQVETIMHKLKISKNRRKRKHKSTFERMSFYARKLFKNDEEMDQVLKQILTGGFGDEIIESSYSKLFLRFKSDVLEHKFINDIKGILVRTYRIYHLATNLLYEVASLLIIAVQKDFVLQEWYDIYFIVIITVQIFISLSTLLKHFHRHIFSINLLIFFIRFVNLQIWFSVNKSVSYAHELLVTQMGVAILVFQYQRYPLISILGGIISVLVYYFLIDQSTDVYQIINHYLIITITVAIVVVIFNRIVCLFIEVFKAQLTMMKENKSLRDNLGILLPPFIRNRLNKQGQFDIQENQGQVGILFCDISDFDTLIRNEQQNIVNILDHLFRQFDNLCSQHGVQKIETVGKTYMAAAGLKAVENSISKSNPINKLISLALDMKKQTQSESFQIKVGIHYGPVIAGVIGYHKPQFSLIGDTINTASRVCSTADGGMISISDDAYKQTNKTDISYKQRVVDAKGKGRLVTYVIGTKRSGRARQATVRIPGNQYMLRHPNPEPQPLSEHEMFTHGRFEQSVLLNDFQNNDTSHRNLDSLRMDLNQRQSILNHIRLSQMKIQDSPQKFMSRMPSQSILEIKLQSSNKIEEQRERKRPSDLKHSLEKAALCDLNISEFDYKVEEQVDNERATQLYAIDDDYQVQKGYLTLNPKKLYLKFNEDNDTTKEFQALTLFLARKQTFILTYVMSFFLVISSLSLMAQGGTEVVPNIIVGLIVAICKGFIVHLMQNNPEKYYRQLTFILLKSFLYLSLALDLFTLSKSAEVQVSKGILYNFSVNFNRTLAPETKLTFHFVYIILVLSAIGYQDWPFSYFYYAATLMAFGFVLQLMMFFKNVSAFNTNKQLEEKHLKQSTLLVNLLPKHILEQFCSTTHSEKVLVDQFEDVTLLFADIAGFTEYSSKVQPEQVVNMLRNLFTEFDKICVAQKVFKLYTIGDCYVVMGLVNGDQKNNRHPAQEAMNVVSTGFSMIEVIRKVRAIVNFPGLDMRIGVHTGTIIGGVLGTELVRYDIYGPDVLIANKMESRGQRGYIQVSEETKQMIESDFPDFFKFDETQSYEFESINRKTKGYFVSV